MRVEELIDVLASRSPEWTSAAQIASLFRVTPRTIRNHVRRVNERGGRTLIESSRLGYRLAAASATLPSSEADAMTRAPASDRTERIIERLVHEDAPMSIYDLADDLFVSDSTIRSNLKKVADGLAPFHLTLERRRDTVSIEGSERDKRRLVGEIVKRGAPFTLGPLDLSRASGQTLDLSGLQDELEGALEAEGLDCNGYEFNNILLHFAIAVNRMAIRQTLPDGEGPGQVNGTPAHRVAERVLGRAGAEHGFHSSEAELRYAALVVQANCSLAEAGAAGPEVGSIIGDEALALTRRVVGRVEQDYRLDPFDDAFVSRLAIHLQALLKRAEIDSYVPNPLTQKTKSTHPLVYDMSVCLANALREETGVVINEDEITFLAFHIGGYFENNRLDGSAVTCAVLYIPYHGQHLALIDYLTATFGDKVAFVEVEPLPRSGRSTTRCDVLLTPVPIAAPHAGMVVEVDPILNERGRTRISLAMEQAIRSKRSARISSMLKKYLRPDLFKCEIVASDAFEAIRQLTGECIDKGLCDERFRRGVLDREHLSSTAFGNQVAVPHSVTPCAATPFLYAVLNERPIPWGEQHVNMVLLIGTTDGDGSSFRMVYERLLETVSDPVNVSRLIGCDTYTEFVDMLGEIMTESQS